MQQLAMTAVETEDTVALGALLSAAADELAALSLAGERLRPLLLRALAVEAAEEAIEEAQTLDYLVQHLTALSVLMERLAAMTPPEACLAATQVRDGLGLSDLERRLLGGVDEGGADAGDFELL
ncbi:MAG: hypothetical protein ABI655_06915 [Phenylobacterium sp.]